MAVNTQKAEGFADHYPEGCPPDDATSASGQLFRLVSNPVTQDDLQTQYEQSGVGDCSSRGLSFFTTQEGVMRLRKSYFDLEKKVIGELQLREEWGRMRLGKKKGRMGSHANVWLYAGTNKDDILKSFRIVEEEES